METVKVGQHVYWTDPDGDMESGNGKVVALQHESVGNDTIISLKMMDGGEVECTLCELSPFRGEYYAELKWHFSDVQTLIDGVSDEEAEAWLFRNAKHLRDRLCELGFEVMDTLLSMDPPVRNECERCGNSPAEERDGEILCADCGMAQEAGELDIEEDDS